MPKLGVNIDHIATVRQARRTFEPDPAKAVAECEKAGCDSIVCHLRKDRRHINDADLENIKKKVTTHLNLEMSVSPEIVDIALRTLPFQATIVPENRKEITTEGGLDVVTNFRKVKRVVKKLAKAGIAVSLFIDPEKDQVLSALDTGARIIEFHTGRYAEAFNKGGDHAAEARVVAEMTALALNKGLVPAAGHGLTYANVRAIARIEGIHELNIGHSIVSRAVFVGLANAVREMKELCA